jgi:hypothetical protein
MADIKDLSEKLDKEADELVESSGRHTLYDGFRKEHVEEARLRYMFGQSIDYIAKKMNIAEYTLGSWVTKGNWSATRLVYQSDIAEFYFKDKARFMAHISGLSLRSIAGALEARLTKHKDKPISIPEAKLIADIFSQLDKIIKLDTGLPTDTIQHVQVSIQDIRDALTKDKFIDVLPVHGSGSKKE